MNIPGICVKIFQSLISLIDTKMIAWKIIINIEKIQIGKQISEGNENYFNIKIKC